MVNINIIKSTILISIIGVVAISSCNKSSSNKSTKVSFYEDGALHRKVEYENNLPNGTCKEYYPTGELLSEGFFKDGKKDSTCIIYYKNGYVKSKGSYKSDKINGLWVDYYTNGNIKFKGYFDHGVEIKEHVTYYEHKNGLIKIRAYGMNVRGKRHTLYYVEYDSLGNEIKEYSPLQITSKKLKSDKSYDCYEVCFEITNPEYDSIRINYGDFDKRFYLKDSTQFVFKSFKGNKACLQFKLQQNEDSVLRGYVEDYELSETNKDKSKGKWDFTTISIDHYFEYSIKVK